MLAICLATWLAKTNSNGKLPCVKHMYLYSISNKQRD